MWPHSPAAHSRPDFELGRGRQVMGGVRCGLRIGLPTSTRGNHMVRARGLIVLTTAALVAFACGGTTGGGGTQGTIKNRPCPPSLNDRGPGPPHRGPVPGQPEKPPRGRGGFHAAEPKLRRR